MCAGGAESARRLSRGCSRPNSATDAPKRSRRHSPHLLHPLRRLQHPAPLPRLLVPIDGHDDELQPRGDGEERGETQWGTGVIVCTQRGCCGLLVVEAQSSPTPAPLAPAATAPHTAPAPASVACASCASWGCTLGPRPAPEWRGRGASSGAGAAPTRRAAPRWLRRPPWRPWRRCAAGCASSCRRRWERLLPPLPPPLSPLLTLVLLLLQPWPSLHENEELQHVSNGLHGMACLRCLHIAAPLHKIKSHPSC